MKVAIGADHRGVEVYKHVALMLQNEGWEVVVMDQHLSKVGCDYPDMAYPVGMAVGTGQADRGILICGSGIGMSIAANKVRGVRAALVHDEVSATLSRKHNDANVLCLAADLLGMRIIERIIRTWLNTPFDGGRHARRIHKIAAIEEGRDPSTVGEESTVLETRNG